MGKVNQSILEEAQKKANTQVQDLGFSSTSKIALGEGSLRQKFGGRYDTILNDLGKDSLGGKSLASGLTEGPTSNKEFKEAVELMAKSLEKTKDLFPSSKIGFDFANEVSKEAEAGDTVTRLNELNKAITALPTNFDNLYLGDFSKFEELISNIEKIKTSGLVADESIKEYDQIISDYSDKERQNVLKKAELDLKNIRDQRELNDKFITDLKGVYEKNVTSVRDLRKGKVQFTKDEFADPFSETGADKLDKFGISGEKRSGISGVTNVGAFSSNFLGAATEDLRKTLDTLKSGGVTGVLDKTSQDILAKQLQDVSLSPQSSPDNATRAALQPFYEAEKLFKTATTSDQFNQAVDLQRQGVRGVQGLNVDPNSDKAFAIKNLIATSAQQAKIVGGVVNTLSLRNPGYVGENTTSNALKTGQSGVGENLDTKEKATVDVLRETLAPLKTFLEGIGKTETIQSGARTATLGEEMPSAVKSVAEYASKINEFAASLNSKDLSGVSQSLITNFTDISYQAAFVKVALEGIAEKTKSFGDAMALAQGYIANIKPQSVGDAGGVIKPVAGVGGNF